ncbi:MAG: response regulator [Humidesulfovibrio sp.]|nr:response regulator [Humidesulfovibrio sp.]
MLRILIIEDAPVNQEFLLLALKPHGECLAVSTGEAGLAEHGRALAEGRPFDLVFLDIMLPGIDGLKTLELLRAAEDSGEVPQSRRVHVIVTTVLDDDKTASRAFIQGNALSYMTKPFRVREITDELQNLGLLQAGE